MKLTEKDITQAVARKMREELGMTQAAFWEPVGVKQSVGCKYEQDVKIPRAVRILLVARYGAGLELDAGTPEGVENIAKLAELQTSRKKAAEEAAAARKELEKASERIQSAHASLARV